MIVAIFCFCIESVRGTIFSGTWIVRIFFLKLVLSLYAAFFGMTLTSRKRETLSVLLLLYADSRREQQILEQFSDWWTIFTRKTGIALCGFHSHKETLDSVVRYCFVFRCRFKTSRLDRFHGALGISGVADRWPTISRSFL